MMQSERLVALCRMCAISRHSSKNVEAFAVASSSPVPRREKMRSSSRNDANSAAT